MPKRSSDPLVLDYAVTNGLLLITCNRDDFIPLVGARTHSGLIVLIRRRSRIVECANLLRLLESAGESGLTGATLILLSEGAANGVKPKP